jgi:hypothetical protein
MQRVTADDVADRAAETSAGTYSCLHAQMLRNTGVGESLSPEAILGNALERT